MSHGLFNPSTRMERLSDVDVSLFTWNLETRRVWTAPNFAAWLNRRPPLPTSLDAWSALAHPDDRETLLASWQSIAAGGSAYDISVRYAAGPGTWRRVREVVCRSEPAVGGAFAVGWRTLLPAELSADSQLAERRSIEIVGHCGRAVAHEFNNLLTAILGYVELAAYDVPDETPLARDLASVREAALRGATLARQLLAVARRDALEPQLVDLGELARQETTLLQRLLGGDVDLRIGLEKHAPLVLADPGVLGQLLMSLALAASQIMSPAGAIGLAVHASRAAGDDRDDHGAELRLTVEPSSSEAHASAGVAATDVALPSLDVVRYLVEVLGATLDSRRTETGGIEVAVRFRATPPTDDPSPGAEEDRDPTGHERVLVVEDEPLVRSLVVGTLRERGYDVLEASHGEDALALLGAPARIPIDLLLTDVVMPILGGHELAHHLVGDGDVRRVLFISGYAEEWVRRQDRHAVGGAFLRKPFTPEALARKVRDVLDDRAG